MKTHNAEILDRVKAIRQNAIAIHDGEDGKDDIGNAEAIVTHCDQLEAAIGRQNEAKAAAEWLERALGRDWYLGDERAEAREDVKTALTLINNWLRAGA